MKFVQINLDHGKTVVPGSGVGRGGHCCYAGSLDTREPGKRLRLHWM